MNRINSPIASGQDHLPLDLLRRYQQGALPGPEEHRVERHLLDCDLCSDVLAGMEARSAGQTSAAVQEINRRVAALGQRAGGKVIPLFSRRNLAAAAALLLLLCSGALVLLYNLQQVRRQEPLAGAPGRQQAPAREPILQAAPGTVADTRPGASPAKSSPAGPVASAAPSTQVMATPSRPSRRPANPLASPEGNAAMPADVKTESLLAAKSDAEQVSDSAQPMQAAIAAAPTAPSSAPAAAGSAPTIAIRSYANASKKEMTGAAPSPGENIVQGRVLDDQGLPLPGVTVTLKGSSLGTTTGADGKYSLALPRHLSQADLTFAYIGFKTQEKKLALSGTSPVNVTLAPDMLALNEVVVVGYGTQRKGAEEEITTAASPQGGWSAFNKYLQANTRQPAAAGRKASGRVVVSFTVQADGSLAGLRVVKSLSPQADAEALRLVQQYPGWQPARAGQEARAQELRASVRFRGSR